MTDGWDALVVGSGPAAALAAAELAGRKVRTLLVRPPGAPEGSAPDDWLRTDDAPVLGTGIPTTLPLDRRVVERRWGLLDRESSLFVEERVPAGIDPVLGWTVRRGQLAPFLRDRAQSRGAEIVAGTPQFDGALRAGEHGGAVSVEGTVHAPRITILCSPPDPAGVPPDHPNERTCWAAFPLEPHVLERRFNVAPGDGVVVDTVLGFVDPPAMARGFLSTHLDAVTVGVVVRGPPAVDPQGIFDRFCRHSAIRGWIGGSTPVRQGTESRSLPRSLHLGGPGVLVAGEALGARFENGVVHDRLGFELRTAQAAAIAATTARASSGPIDAVGEYRRTLSRMGLDRELARTRRAARGVEWNPRLYQVYPPFATAVFHRLMTETGHPKESIAHAVDEVRRESGVRRGDLALDLLRLGTSL